MAFSDEESFHFATSDEESFLFASSSEDDDFFGKMAWMLSAHDNDEFFLRMESILQDEVNRKHDRWMLRHVDEDEMPQEIPFDFTHEDLENAHVEEKIKHWEEEWDQTCGRVLRTSKLGHRRGKRADFVF